MNTKNTWVKCVGYVVLVVALIGAPAVVQAAPVQGGEEEVGTQWAPLDWISGLGQIWDRVKAALGFSSAPQPPKNPAPQVAPQIPMGPGSNEMTTESASLDSSQDRNGTIDPVG